MSGPPGPVDSRLMKAPTWLAALHDTTHATAAEALQETGAVSYAATGWGVGPQAAGRDAQEAMLSCGDQ